MGKITVKKGGRRNRSGQSKCQAKRTGDELGLCWCLPPRTRPVDMQKAGVPLQGHCAHGRQVQRKLLDCNGESSVGPWCW